jgi:N-acyl-D-aspartate/D-glutamate deacylase
MAKFDLVIRAGSVVDGNGGLPVTADIAVSDGVIKEVGRFSGSGNQEIDADGAVVSPGFVDVHTHYDGQATWDDRLQPSSWHGVTTAVMGNCGVGFAPVLPDDRNRLVKLMEGVEDIPGVAMIEGIPWTWQSFPEYLDALEKNKYDVDLAAQVPHAALRVHAMGERAAAYETATKAEIDAMAGLAKEAIEAGAFGFSTSRTLNHKSLGGELTPSYEASTGELVAIARAIGETGKGVLQLVTDFPDVDADIELMRDMVAASGRPMSVALIYRSSEPQRHVRILEGITQANEDGLQITAQVPVRGIGMLLGLQCTLNPFLMNPVWQEISSLPWTEQAARMSDPDLKSRMLAAQTDEIKPSVVGGSIIQQWDVMFELTDPPNYEPPVSSSIGSIARRTGFSPVELAYDIIVKEGGNAMIYIPGAGYDGSLDGQGELLRHRYSIPALSDGGAHVGTICDASFPTSLLQHWVRDRGHDRLDLSFAIQRQSRDTARAVGFTDRGQIVPGFKADINVIDLDRLRVYRPEMRFDLPAGGKRLLQRVDGYKHTIVSGVETYRDGVPTGSLPGRLVRSSR